VQQNVNFKAAENCLVLPGVNDIIENPNVAMLFIDFTQDIRYKISGIATIVDDKDTISQYLNFKGFDYS